MKDIAGGISYSPHTVQGTWTIVLTIIFSVFILLLLLRALAPVKPVAPSLEMAAIGFDSLQEIPTREFEMVEV